MLSREVSLPEPGLDNARMRQGDMVRALNIRSWAFMRHLSQCHTAPFRDGKATGK